MESELAEILEETSELQAEPKPISHPVKFYENGDRPLEIVTSRQWYLKNGGLDMDLRVGRVLELLRHVGIGEFGDQFLGAGDRAHDAVGSRFKRTSGVAPWYRQCCRIRGL